MPPHRGPAHKISRAWAALQDHGRSRRTRLAACSARGLCQNQTGLMYPWLGRDHVLPQPLLHRTQLPAPWSLRGRRDFGTCNSRRWMWRLASPLPAQPWGGGGCRRDAAARPQQTRKRDEDLVL